MQMLFPIPPRIPRHTCTTCKVYFEESYLDGTYVEVLVQMNKGKHQIRFKSYLCPSCAPKIADMLIENGIAIEEA